MGRTETLQQIKEAEARVLAMKREAEAEKERILRESRRGELELQEGLRKEGEERYSKLIAEAKQVVTGEREAILEKGRRDAKKVKDEGMKNFEKAVERLVGKFKGALDA